MAVISSLYVTLHNMIIVLCCILGPADADKFYIESEARGGNIQYYHVERDGNGFICKMYMGEKYINTFTIEKKSKREPLYLVKYKESGTVPVNLDLIIEDIDKFKREGEAKFKAYNVDFGISKDGKDVKITINEGSYRGQNYLVYKEKKKKEELQQKLNKKSIIEFRFAQDKAADGYVKYVNRAGKDIYCKNEIIFNNKDIKSVTKGIDYHSRRIINLELTPDSAIRFAEITRKNIRRKIAIIVDGKVAIAPTIVDEIKNGRIQISGEFTPDEIEDLINSFK